jgi:hypothetical protein
MQDTMSSSDPSRVAQIGNRENGQVEAANNASNQNGIPSDAPNNALAEIAGLQSSINNVLKDQIAQDIAALDDNEPYQPPTPYNWTPELLEEIYGAKQVFNGPTTHDVIPCVSLSEGSMFSFDDDGKSIRIICEDKAVSVDEYIGFGMKAISLLASVENEGKESVTNKLLNALIKVMTDFKGVRPNCPQSEYLAEMEADQQAELGCALLEAEGVKYDEADKICDALDEEMAEAVTDRDRYGALRFIKNQVKRTGYSSSSIYKAMKAGIIPDELVVRKTRHCKKLRLRDNFERYMVDAGIRRRRKGWTRKVSK